MKTDDTENLIDARKPRIKSLKDNAKKREKNFDRTPSVVVKTAKGRKISSTLWLQRQLNDPYVAAARDAGYRSRAAFKLLDLNTRYNFLKKGQTIIDLGAAPGGWSQICAEHVDSINGHGRVIGIDSQDMPPIPGVTFFHRDFSDDDVPDLLINAAGQKVDAVISDMAPFTIGVKSADQLRIVQLVDLAAEFSLKILKKNGIFIAKLFENGINRELSIILQKNFKTVKHFKPKSSRRNSSEIFVVAIGFIGDKTEA
ncbi:MAG: 23S rRNA (uridine2552-2'-O)-methyltransferase [Alphaproteobacteria bacterium]|jgi:23S rRNA (uridine2552-2'-O)-methyltransferase